VPIIRTFAPTVAGAAQMDYRKFVFYNIAGGVSWVFSMVGGGYLLGQTFPGLKKHIELVVLGIIFVSVLPIAWEAWKARRSRPAPGTAPDPSGD
jgi:membrane-associated protein